MEKKREAKVPACCSIVYYHLIETLAAPLTLTAASAKAYISLMKWIGLKRPNLLNVTI